MDYKLISKGENPLNKKIIESKNVSFTLWLEFEETAPWEDLKNDFANVIVTTLDGRRLGFNIWTYKFLETSIKVDREENKKLNALYQTPPDLFVKELTRDCIEKTIVDLFNKDHIEQQLNRSTFALEFLTPYWDAIEMEDDHIDALLHELSLELPNNHFLKGEEFILIAKKTNSDEIVLELKNGIIAVVHLTWTSKTERDGYPITRIYASEFNFWEKEMKEDILEFNR